MNAVGSVFKTLGFLVFVIIIYALLFSVKSKAIVYNAVSPVIESEWRSASFNNGLELSLDDNSILNSSSLNLKSKDVKTK